MLLPADVCWRANSPAAPASVTKLLLISFYFPPAGGVGVLRPLKLAALLAELGIETHVLAPDDPRWIHRDPDLPLPPGVRVHRARYLGPRGRLPAEELYGLSGLPLAWRRALLTPRRLLVPDENVTWLAAALPRARSIVRRHAIDVVLTTSPPTSVHLIGAALAPRAGVRWIADLRDSIVAKPDRRYDRRLVRVKERAHVAVARLAARRADAIVAVTPTIAEQMRALGAAGEVALIPNGADFADFDGLAYEPGERFRITHTGSFFGRRDPRPFLSALAGIDAPVTARFVGDFRAADRAWVEGLGLGQRLQLIPYQPHGLANRLQRDSEALLLLLPHEGGRGTDVPSGKLFEYLAARRPILAAVPTAGAAAALVREAGAGIVVEPDDEQAIAAALAALVERWRKHELDDVQLPEQVAARIDRRARARELAELIEQIT
jgi:glycosyltransferase involved in cell wall biosynthesis